MLKKIRRMESAVQIPNDTRKAIVVERWISNEKTKRNKTLIASSAGMTKAASDATVGPLEKAMKSKAITMVDGSVPMIPPILDPNRSATYMISMTTNADRIKGSIIWKRSETMTGLDRIKS